MNGDNPMDDVRARERIEAEARERIEAEAAELEATRASWEEAGAPPAVARTLAELESFSLNEVQYIQRPAADAPPDAAYVWLHERRERARRRGDGRRLDDVGANTTFNPIAGMSPKPPTGS